MARAHVSCEENTGNMEGAEEKRAELTAAGCAREKNPAGSDFYWLLPCGPQRVRTVNHRATSLAFVFSSRLSLFSSSISPSQRALPSLTKRMQPTHGCTRSFRVSSPFSRTQAALPQQHSSSSTPTTRRSSTSPISVTSLHDRRSPHLFSSHSVRTNKARSGRRKRRR